MTDPITNGERARLERAHHEICTALTVLRSNVALVRIHLRGTPLPESVPGASAPLHADLDALEGAVERLHRTAREMKRWHDGTPTHASVEARRLAADSANLPISTP